MTPAPGSRTSIVVVLGATQTLAWASSYYLPAILAAPISQDLRISSTTVFAAFSAALLLSAAMGPLVGRTIDRAGGRDVLCASNVLLAAGLALLASAHGVAVLVAAWLVLGMGMGCGLYETAFATLAALYGREARGPITGITLIAGFASTVGWPLTAMAEHHAGWRAACLAWASLHVLAGLPLNWLLVPSGGRELHLASLTRPGASGDIEPPAAKAMAVLAGVFAAWAVVSTGMAAHLPRVFETAGATASVAVAAAALVGPAQVAARLAEFGLMRRVAPVVSAQVAAMLHPVGAVALATFGAPCVCVFAVLHGAGNGLLTIARGTLPLSLFGPASYGLRIGLLSAPARVAQAAAPLLFGILLDNFGLEVLALSAALGVASAAALRMLRAAAVPPEKLSTGREM